MFQFFVEPHQVGTEKITITGPDVNHIKNVLRMKPGTKVRISNKEDKDYICHITELSDEEIIAVIDDVDTAGTELPADIVLFQGLPKGDKMETVIQKNVELGVKRIVPVAMSRSIVKLDAKKAKAKVERWQRIAESAAKQSKRMIIPEISPVATFKEAIDEMADMDIILFPYENAEGMTDTRAAIETINKGDRVAIFIGPEGGFEPEEVSKATEAGAKVISLGKRILRTETAGMALMSMIMYRLED
ncbi:MAG: 16S rRNA (uracil(1498)-N(3))-methyltransferase [Lachnospiraceae bacterium]|nr:16S rRNA (uracil(1498)-N(3))-methyltransferase [Lachnospiraceae bacterium]